MTTESDDLNELQAAGEEAAMTDLRAISALAYYQLELEGDLDKLEAAVKAKKGELRKISEGELPAALKAARMTTFILDNGMTVGYEEDLKIHIPAAKKAIVIKTMKDWGYSGDVSNVLTVDLGKGNDNAAKALIAQAEEMGVKATLTENINSGTVKKALRKRAKDGIQDDLGQFGAFAFTKATVK